MNKINIKIGESRYPYYIADGMLDLFKVLLKVNTDRFLIIYDQNIKKNLVNSILEQLEARYKCSILALKVSETMKTFKSLEKIIKYASSCNLTNRSTVIAIGGGVLGNIAGMVASLLFRGIKLVHIPTTIIAAADSTLSLKQAINSDNCKNGIGTFYVPAFVILVPDFFLTLPLREFNAGIVETTKNILCINPKRYSEFCLINEKYKVWDYKYIRYITECSIVDKMAVLKNDYMERQEGLVLEYGHTNWSCNRIIIMWRN